LKFSIHYIIFLIPLFGIFSENVVSKFSLNKENATLFLKLAENINLSYNKRLSSNKKALAILLTQKNDSSNREKLIRVSKNFYNLNQWKNLKATATMLQRRSFERKKYYHIASSYRWLAIYYENTSANDSAFYYYLKAEKIFKNLKSEKNLCKIYCDEAQVQYYVNDYLGTEQSLIKSLIIAKKLKLEYQQYLIYYSLGLTSTDMGDYSKAFEYYDKALKLSKKNEIDFSNNHATAFCLNMIASNYSSAGNIKKAIKIYKEALKEKNLKSTAPMIYCRLIDNLSYSKTKLKQFDSLPRLYFKTGKIRDSLKIDQGKNYNKLYLSEYYSSIKDTANAKKYAYEAFRLSKDFRAPKDMLLCLKRLAIVEPKNALTYSNEYIRISDSMHKLERETRNKFAKIAYETEEITNEKDEAVHQKWVFLGIAILIFVFGVLIFIIIYQRNRQKEMLLIQQQQKNNEEIYQLIQTRQSKIDEGREIEKKRIAQDLHDGIMNKLASTRLNLHILNIKNDAQTIKKCLTFVDDIQNIEKEIRNIAHDLNKDAFSTTDSFIAVIESLFEEQKAIYSTKCHLEIDYSIHWDSIESTKKIHIYRILQEALSNSNKHAHAQNIVASILNKENHILLEIYDDGIGFSLNGKKKGIGLQNIYSRVKSCKGIIEIKTKKGEGTTLIIKIPKKAKQNPTDNGNTNTYPHR
jgi:signal transduction histidine kinase